MDKMALSAQVAQPAGPRGQSQWQCTCKGNNPDTFMDSAAGRPGVCVASQECSQLMQGAALSS